MTDRDTNNKSAMRNLFIALSVYLVVAACNHLSGQGGPTTTQQEMDNGNGNGGGLTQHLGASIGTDCTEVFDRCAVNVRFDKLFEVDLILNDAGDQ